MQAHHDMQANRAGVLSGHNSYWEAGPRSAVELKEAAAHFDQAATLCNAPAQKAIYVTLRDSATHMGSM